MIRGADTNGWGDRSKPPKGYIVFTEDLFSKVLEQLEPEIAEYLVSNYVFKEGFVRASIDQYDSLPAQREIKKLLVSNSIRKKRLSEAYFEEIYKVVIRVLISNGKVKRRTDWASGFWKKKETPQVELADAEFDYGFVYFIRNKDIYKIGITQNLLARLDQLKPDEVLNIVRCTNYEELEKVLHKSFKGTRIPQSEYFRLTPNQVKKAHQLMTTKANF